MHRILNILTIFFCVFIVVFPNAYLYNKGKHENFLKLASAAKGQVVALDSGILIVEFDTPIINPCGDTQIFTYITGPAELPIQLKPIFIPEAKAKAFKVETGQVLVFPLFDVMFLIQDEGRYNIEVFINNSCGISNKSIQLPTFNLEVSYEKDVNVSATHSAPGRLL